MIKKILMAFSAALALSINPVFAQVDEKRMNVDELKAEVSRIVDQTELPALGVVLVDRDGILWSESLGTADLANNRPADSHTLFRIGSISKTVTAVALMQLVEQGTLSLQDNLRDVAPELEFSNRWAQTHPVKVVHLLEHTTGWDAHLAEYAFKSNDNVTTEQALAHHPDSRTSRWPPGTRAAYNNTGALVVAYLIEKATGERFEDYVQQNIFAPLDMDGATLWQTDAVKNRGAVSYMNGREQPFVHVHTRPASSVSITPEDMGKFIRIFVTQGHSNGVQILTPESIERMQQGVSTLGAAKGIVPDFTAGLHLRGFEDRGLPLFGHSGGLGGAISDFQYSPDSGLGYAIMLNANNGEAYQRLNEVLSRYILQDVPAAQFEPVALDGPLANLDGWYRPVNPLLSLGEIKSDLMDILSIKNLGDKALRAPVAGGWQSEDISEDGETLINPWSGQPSVAFVNDPIIGEALQVQGTLYQKTSVLAVVSRWVIWSLVALASLTSVLFALVWLPRLWFGKKLNSGPGIAVRRWPLFSALTLVAIPVSLMLMGAGPTSFGPYSPASLSLLVLTSLYPLFSALGVYSLYRHRPSQVGVGVYWHSAFATFAHVAFSLYLASYGLLFFVIWY